MPEKQRIREVDGLKYILTLKDVKNINLHIKADGNIYVSANRRMPLYKIDEFIRANLDRIENARQKVVKKSEKNLFPQEFSDGAEFYFLGEKKRISVTKNKSTYLDGNTLFLSVSSDNSLEKAFVKWVSAQAVDTFGKYVEIVYKHTK